MLRPKLLLISFFGGRTLVVRLSGVRTQSGIATAEETRQRVSTDAAVLSCADSNAKALGLNHPLHPPVTTTRRHPEGVSLIHHRTV